jgi:hypothetical protein
MTSASTARPPTAAARTCCVLLSSINQVGAAWRPAMGTARWSAVRPVAGAQVVGGPRVLPHRRMDEQVLSRDCREEGGSTKLSREDKDGGAGFGLAEGRGWIFSCRRNPELKSHHLAAGRPLLRRCSLRLARCLPPAREPPPSGPTSRRHLAPADTARLEPSAHAPWLVGVACPRLPPALAREPRSGATLLFLSAATVRT